MIKKFVSLSASLGLFFLANGQPVTPPTAYAAPYPNNYIRAWVAKAPETSPTALMSRPLRDVLQTTQYMDGLGRPIETVVKKGSLTSATSINVDLISPVVYDNYGREQYKYLPFASTATDITKDNGLFKLNPFQQQASFYGSADASKNPIANQSETFYYGLTNFETSPLNRVLESYAPGNSWAGTSSQVVENNRRAVKGKFYFNTVTDDVKRWNVTNGSLGTFGTYALAGTPVYPLNELEKTITVDEMGKQVIEFKNKDGKVILKKAQLTAVADDGSGSGYTGWLCTYYIYDDLGNLSCVVQPRGVELLAANSWNLSALSGAILNEQCFRYAYDSRDRMIMKKVPGAAEVYMVYDVLDRLVMTQDANMRSSGKWLVTKYDAIDRPTETGLLTNATSFTTHLSTAAASTSYPSTTSNYELLTITHYDDYDNDPILLAMGKYIDPYLITPYNTSPTYSMLHWEAIDARGKVTWTQTKVLGTVNTFLYSVNFYDDYGRLIQTQTTNQTGGQDVVATQYNWSGQPIVIAQYDQNGVTDDPTTITTLAITQMTYDDLGRLIKTEKKLSSTLINSNAMSAFATISENQYDAIGQLKTKTIGNKKDGSGVYLTPRQPLESLTYDYNIRGWMLGMNRDYAKDGNNTNYFGFDLGYDKINNGIIGSQTYTNPQYNGNIEGMVWKSKGDGEKRKYDFTYDAANRLLKADFNQYTSSAFNKTAGIDFSMQMGDGSTATSAYDANGNIKAMKQWGLKVTGSSVIDDLAYTYNDNSNKLKNVIDAQNDVQTKLGDFRSSQVYMTALGGTKTNTAIDYSYDNNGNLTKDLNKDISDPSYDGITYNYLNLPSLIRVKNKGTITYVYDAAGDKLQKITSDITTSGKTITTTTDYLAGFVFESRQTLPANSPNDDYTAKLQFLPQEEGRIRPVYDNLSTPNTPTSFESDYFLKDHLGNVRMVLTEQVKKDIYPAATLEDLKQTIEPAYYTIDNSKIVLANTVTGLPNYANNNIIHDNPVDLPFEGTNSAKLYKLNGSTNKTGLGITLKVMAGDIIDILGKTYYFQNNTGGAVANSAIPYLEILNGMIGSPNGTVGASGHGDVTGTQLNALAGTTGGIQTLFNNQTTQNGANPQVPKAYVNYIFFDEQFKCVGSGYSAVGTNSVVKDIHDDFSAITVPKNGYIYVYCSNESPVNVFFDNLQVTHIRGPILEETHYYPFGLTMAGISSKALSFGNPENKKNKFQNQEYNDDLGVDLYEFKYRMDDPQTGRFWQIDPLASKYVYNSVFAFSENHVTTHTELEGKEKVSIQQKSNASKTDETAINAAKKALSSLTGASNGKYGFYTPLVTANVSAGAGAAIDIKGAEGHGGITTVFAGVKDNDVYFNATNLKTNEVTLFQGGGGSFLGFGKEWEDKIIDNNGKHTTESKTETERSFLLFTTKTENNFKTHEKTVTKNFDLGAAIGIGIILNASITIPYYKETEKTQ